jgi:hypothetical protein
MHSSSFTHAFFHFTGLSVMYTIYCVAKIVNDAARMSVGCRALNLLS